MPVQSHSEIGPLSGSLRTGHVGLCWITNLFQYLFLTAGWLMMIQKDSLSEYQKPKLVPTNLVAHSQVYTDSEPLLHMYDTQRFKKLTLGSCIKQAFPAYTHLTVIKPQKEDSVHVPTVELRGLRDKEVTSQASNTKIPNNRSVLRSPWTPGPELSTLLSELIYSVDLILLLKP